MPFSYLYLIVRATCPACEARPSVRRSHWWLPPSAEHTSPSHFYQNIHLPICFLLQSRHCELLPICTVTVGRIYLFQLFRIKIDMLALPLRCCGITEFVQLRKICENESPKWDLLHSCTNSVEKTYWQYAECPFYCVPELFRFFATKPESADIPSTCRAPR